MAEAAKIFLSSFNRIEKWMQREVNPINGMGFSQLVRKLSNQPILPIRKYENDLLQISQLRNAIVHDQIGEDFIIAEPNEWVITRILQIEKELYEPERVLPRFAKKVTGFTINLPVPELLNSIAKKRYSQFPLYKNGKFQGLLTLRMLGYWYATHFYLSPSELANLTAKDLLTANGKRTNYQFVASNTSIAEVQNLFIQSTTLEAILITEDGQEDGQLVGIIRPRDVVEN